MIALYPHNLKSTHRKQSKTFCFKIIAEIVSIHFFNRHINVILKEEEQAHIVQYHILIIICVLIMYDRIKSFFFENIYMYIETLHKTQAYIYTYIYAQKKRPFYMKSYS